MPFFRNPRLPGVPVDSGRAPIFAPVESSDELLI